MQPIRLIPDQAIAELDNTRTDALGFSSYADVIARIVEGTRGPFTIGIFGEWGMGKTSLMKMVEQRVQNIGTEDHIVVPVWFNAWMFEKVEYPIVPLIKSITEALKAQEDLLLRTGHAGKTLIDALEALVGAFKLKGKLGLPGSFANVEAEIGFGAARETFKHLRKTRMYGYAHDDPYENIFDAFRSISNNAVPRNITIMVLIDDLDRCFPENAVRLLEGIKLVLSQPGFIFILGASRVVIEEYLQSKYQKQYGITHYDGSAYLDKMIQLSFDIPPHTNRIADFTKHIIADLGDKRTARDLAPISSVIGGVCQYNPRTIIRFINRLITDSAIYRQNSGSTSARLPVGIFAVTRSLQLSWRDFYGLLIGDDTHEDREYCEIVSSWSADDIAVWKLYNPALSDQPTALSLKMQKLKHADPEVLKRLADQLASDRILRTLMEGKIGREWLTDYASREMSISFLTTQSPTEEAPAVDPSSFIPQNWNTPNTNSQAADEALYKEAIRVVVLGGKASTSLLQRRLRIGYGRAARLIEEMEKQGIVGPADGARPREVLIHSINQILDLGLDPNTQPVAAQPATPAAPKPNPTPAPTTEEYDPYTYGFIGQ